MQFDTYGFTICFFFFFNDTATTEIYTLSLHDALPISLNVTSVNDRPNGTDKAIDIDEDAAHVFDESEFGFTDNADPSDTLRSEEHTSELQSRQYLVCRLLLEKKKKQIKLPQQYLNHPT